MGQSTSYQLKEEFCLVRLQGRLRVHGGVGAERVVLRGEGWCGRELLDELPKVVSVAPGLRPRPGRPAGSLWSDVRHVRLVFMGFLLPWLRGRRGGSLAVAKRSGWPTYLLQCLVVDKAGRILGYLELALLNLLTELPETGISHHRPAYSRGGPGKRRTAGAGQRGKIDLHGAPGEPAASRRGRLARMRFSRAMEAEGRLVEGPPRYRWLFVRRTRPVWVAGWSHSGRPDDDRVVDGSGPWSPRVETSENGFRWSWLMLLRTEKLTRRTVTWTDCKARCVYAWQERSRLREGRLGPM